MIYLIVSAVLDLFLSSFVSLGYQNINYFFPLILVSSLPISFLLIKNKKLFFTSIIVLSILYDLLYSDIVLINLYYFILYGLFLYIFYSNKKASILNILLISLGGIILYDSFIFLILILTNYSSLYIRLLLYKISHSLALNIIYVVLSLIILNSRIFGYKKRRRKVLKR